MARTKTNTQSNTKTLRTRRRNIHSEKKTIFSYKQAYIVPMLMVIKMYTQVLCNAFPRPTDKLQSVNPLQTNI